jgi:phage shock protein PspC (stress-responsive transcriptional regulator)
MDKTININLGGTLFQIDEEAFRKLREYLQAINNRLGNLQGGHETIEDIESRIAEIFNSQKGLAGVITIENVDAMISIIGKPEDFEHGEPEATTPVYTSQKRRIYRNPDDSIISGVCGGIGAYLDTDPVLFRILFVVSAMFGIGLFVYIVLWIALPVARTDSQKREMFGDSHHTARSYSRQHNDYQVTGTPVYTQGYNSSSRIGNAINEIFRAIGKVLYIIVRIFLIMIGVVLVLTGFLSLLCFVMVVVFKFPGVYSIDSSGINLINFTDFLNYIVSPSTVPWITFLMSIVFILPMIAIIYWGVKMIFWFRARDGVVSLVAFVVWIMAISALTVIGLNEGVSFAHSARTSAEIVLPASPDTLYVVTDNKIADLKYEKDFKLPHEEYSVYINDEKKELYIRSYLAVDKSENKSTTIEARKYAAGRTEMEATKKTEGLLFNYRIKGDTLHLDEYFTSPAGRKWSADNVGVNLFIPLGTILKFENNPRILLHSSFRNESDEYLESSWESGNSLWVMTNSGLEQVPDKTTKHK